MTEPQQFLIYQSEDGSTRIDVMLEAETLWLNQRQLTELFGKAKGTISEHIKHIFEDGELTPAATVRLFRTVQPVGGRNVTREVEHYNLEMVLALGFRVRSPLAVRFRQWAHDKLKEYIVKGFVRDDARLKKRRQGAITSMSLSAACKTSAPANGASTRRLPTSTRPAWITTRAMR